MVVEYLKELIIKRQMNVFLATVNGWDGKSIIGVFSSKDKALTESITYLLKTSISLNKDEIHTPINEEIGEYGSAWDITNSDDVLAIRIIGIDEVMKDNKRY